MPNVLKHRVPPDRLTKPAVAIIGFTDHRVQAFQLDRSRFELWGLNEMHRYHDVKLFDRWFEIHPRAALEPDPEHLKALAGFDIPVYMQQHHDDIPPSVPFPHEAIEQALDSTYFTSTPAWEIAMAIMMGAEEIHLYGVDMAMETEYAEQRNCCEFWLGVAKGRGIKLYLPPTSDLLKCVGQYGFDRQGNEFSQKVSERLNWLHQQDNEQRVLLRNLDAQQREGEKAVAYQSGVIRALEFVTQHVPAGVRATFRADDGTEVERDVRERLAEDLQSAHDTDNDYRRKLRELAQKKAEVEVNLHTLRGAIQDCTFWKRSWAVPAASDGRGGPHVDRSQDPRTGITPLALAPAGDSKPEGRPEVIAAAQAAAQEA